MANYAEKLRDPRWQKKRLEALEYYGWQCCDCSDDEETLNVHHKIYRRGADVWDYSIDDLVVLCETCHKTRHACDDAIKEILSRCDPCTINGIMAGLFVSSDYIEKDHIKKLLDNSIHTDVAVGMVAALLMYLPRVNLLEVAKFAVEFTVKNSEARMILAHDSTYKKYLTTESD